MIHLTRDDAAVYMTHHTGSFDGPAQTGPLHAWHFPDGTWGIYDIRHGTWVIYDIRRGRWVKRGEQ
jgi:hypothetical protein